MTEPFESNPFASLTPADAAALDSLVESGFDPSLAASEPRTARAYALMAGLDSPVADGAPELIADSVIDRNRARLLLGTASNRREIRAPRPGSAWRRRATLWPKSLRT